MPFNPRFLASTDRFGNFSIPTEQFHMFLSLNNHSQTQSKFDSMVYCYLLNALAKEFYSVQIPTHFSEYLAPEEYTNYAMLHYCCDEILNNVTNLIWKKR